MRHTYKIVLWVFPFYLIIMEYIFRSVNHQNPSGFIGPAIALVGLTFLVPLLKPRGVDREHPGYKKLVEILKNHEESLKESELELTDSYDDTLIEVVLVCIGICTLIWLFSMRVAENELSRKGQLHVPTHVLLGFVNFLISAILTTIKDIRPFQSRSKTQLVSDL